jgi:hypothetical protein
MGYDEAAYRQDQNVSSCFAQSRIPQSRIQGPVSFLHDPTGAASHCCGSDPDIISPETLIVDTVEDMQRLCSLDTPYARRLAAVVDVSASLIHAWKQATGLMWCCMQ